MDGHRASRRCGCGSAAGGAARTAGRDDLRLWARTRTPPFRRLCHVEIRAQHRRTTCMSAPASPPPAGCLLEEGRSERPPPPPQPLCPCRRRPTGTGSAPLLLPGAGGGQPAPPPLSPPRPPPAWPAGGEGGLGSGCGWVQRRRVFWQQGRAPRRRVAGSSLLFVLL